MQSDAKTVRAYLNALPEDRRAALQVLRKKIRAAAPNAVETMSYGMPTYERDGQPLFALASQKHHLALYVCEDTDLVESARGDLIQGIGVSVGKSCIRFKHIDRLPMPVIEKLLRDAAAR